MQNANRKRICWLVVGLSISLLFMVALRYSAASENALTPLSGYATIGYILATVIFTIFMVRAGRPLNRFGFGIRLNRHETLFDLLLSLVSAPIIHLVFSFFFGLKNDMPFIDIPSLWELL